MLTVYQHPLSTFGRRVRMMLLEKGVEARFVDLDMAHREHRQGAYLKVNPYGRVPAVVDESGRILFESTAILEYLEASHPEPPLLPVDPWERGEVAMHIKLCDLELSRFTRELFFPRRFLPRERWDLVEMDRCRKTGQHHLDVLEEALRGKTFLVGERYTLAELCYTPFVDFLPLLELNPGPATAAWIARLQERPSAKATRLPR
jgi:glutathione S-transferase